jgi:hypothetical protein
LHHHNRSLITYPERQRERPEDVLATCNGF